MLGVVPRSTRAATRLWCLFLLAAWVVLVAVSRPNSPVLAAANDNRVPAGAERGGIRTVELEARLAHWRPDADVDSVVTVQAFAEAGAPPSIPGPLLRAEQGTVLRLTLRNRIPDSTLVVHGLRIRPAPHDTVQVAPGAVRTLEVGTSSPGTFLYWGTTSRNSYATRTGRDAQLTGALIIDPSGSTPDTSERIFVLTVIDILPDSTRPPPREDIWEVAINGRSWPHTERMHYTVGDTVRWRWLNGTFLPHPMHLHGFHFRTLARGDGMRDSAFTPHLVPEVVTEFMPPGATFRMAWVPTRGGNWLMHCHMLPHVIPFPDRPDSMRTHDTHDPARHALDGMAGLVLGITVAERDGAAPDAASGATPAHRLRLLVQQARADSGSLSPRGYVLHRGAEPRPDSVEVPGPPLLLVRGETTAITVVNRLPRATTVHWHGMELLSVYDGVSGWSGLDARRAPLVAPGDSFTVAITPPRAGTFIYHTHMDESRELGDGLYGPLIVLEPGERWAPDTDLPMIIAEAIIDGVPGPALNGARHPEPRTVSIGTTYRLRVINIARAEAARVALLAEGAAARWVHVAKDGATLPPALRRTRTDTLIMGTGETYDFEWTPSAAGDVIFEVRLPFGAPPLRQTFRVVPAPAR